MSPNNRSNPRPTHSIKTGVLILVFMAVATAAAETPPEIRAMVKKSLSGINREDDIKDSYLFRVHTDRREFDSNGKELSRKWWIVEREVIDGVLVGRVRERDGKPIPAEEHTRQEETIRKHVAAEKAKKATQNREERRPGKEDEAWIQEFPEALDYKIVGEESINGRPALVLDFVPRPGYRPTSLRGRFFEKARGRVWIDKAELEMVRTEAEIFDTISIGFGVAGKLYKGTTVRLVRRRVGNAVWLTEDQHFRFNARVMLVKTVNRQVAVKFTDFRLRPDRAPMAKDSR